MELRDPEKVPALISLSNHAYEETRRYRDYTWKMLVWTVGLILAVLPTTRTTPIWAATCPGKSLGSVFIATVAVLGGWNICFAHRQFVRNRNLLRDCERRLQFHEKGAYGEGKTVLPENWKTEDYRFSPCFPHLLRWMFIIAVVAAYSTYTLIIYVTLPSKFRYSSASRQGRLNGTRGSIATDSTSAKSSKPMNAAFQYRQGLRETLTPTSTRQTSTLRVKVGRED